MTLTETVLLVLGTLGVVSLVTLVVIVAEHPMLAFPRYRFNALLPRVLNTGAVTILGWCFVRRQYITAQHRAHEQYHHVCALTMGRWKHLGMYLVHFVGGLRRYGLATVTPAQRTYLKAYWLHPEEVAARAYADANAHRYTDIVAFIR